MPKYKQTRAAKGLTRRIRDFTDLLRRDYAREIARDVPGFKRNVVRMVRLGLPPGPGRPADGMVTLAVRLRARGVPWMRVYWECIPGFAELGDGIRQLAMTRLRTAVRSRRIRHKQKPVELLPQKILV